MQRRDGCTQLDHVLCHGQVVYLGRQSGHGGAQCIDGCLRGIRGRVANVDRHRLSVGLFDVRHELRAVVHDEHGSIVQNGKCGGCGIVHHLNGAAIGCIPIQIGFGPRLVADGDGVCRRPGCPTQNDAATCAGVIQQSQCGFHRAELGGVAAHQGTQLSERGGVARHGATHGGHLRVQRGELSRMAVDCGGVTTHRGAELPQRGGVGGDSGIQAGHLRVQRGDLSSMAVQGGGVTTHRGIQLPEGCGVGGDGGIQGVPFRVQCGELSGLAVEGAGVTTDRGTQLSQGGGVGGDGGVQRVQFCFRGGELTGLGGQRIGMAAHDATQPRQGCGVVCNGPAHGIQVRLQCEAPHQVGGCHVRNVLCDGGGEGFHLHLHDIVNLAEHILLRGLRHSHDVITGSKHGAFFVPYRKLSKAELTSGLG